MNVGAVVFLAYNVVITLVLVNMLVSIVCDSFEVILQQIRNEDDQVSATEIFYYMRDKMQMFFLGLKSSTSSAEASLRPSDYLSYFDKFKISVDQLLVIFKNVSSAIYSEATILFVPL